MEIRFINTDAKSNDGKSFHDTWISRGIAVASGADKYRAKLQNIDPSDILALYVNNIGLIAIGVPIDNQTFDVTDPEKIVSPLEGKEYHRRVDWCVDLRGSPISVDEMRSLGAPPTPHYVRRVSEGKAQVAVRFAQLLSEPTSHEGVDRLVKALQQIGKVHVPRFQIGKTYNRKSEIHDPFGGNSQSGISTPKDTNAIFLFTSKTGEKYGYVDGYIVDEKGRKIFQYAGEGQIGDMKFTNGNLAILDHAFNASALHLFQSLGKGKDQEYIGEFVYAGHRFGQGPDKNGKQRKIIIFELLPVDQLSLLDAMAADGDTLEVSRPKSLAEARALAIAAPKPTDSRSGQAAVRNLYARSKAVKDYVLMRAQGICESCEKPSPFQRPDGTPYLEPHHTTRLSDGGPDHPRYVGAVCPDCHREIHYGMHGAAKNAALQSHLLKTEAE